MSFNCPNCESENTQKLSSIYSGGTTTARSYSTGSFNGVSLGSQNVGIIAGSTSGSTQTTNQSMLAAQLAPPQQLSEKWIGAALFIGPLAGAALVAVVQAILSSIFAPFIGSWIVAIIFWSAILGSFFGGIFMVSKFFKSKANANKKYNQTTYAEQMKLWQSQFYCHKCSNIFVPE